MLFYADKFIQTEIVQMQKSAKCSEDKNCFSFEVEKQNFFVSERWIGNFYGGIEMKE